MAKSTKGTVFKRGKVWYYRFRYKGKLICKAGTENQEETEILMNEAINDCKRTHYVIEAKEKMEEIIHEWYLTQEIRLKHGTRGDYENAINNHIIPVFGSRKIGSITSGELQAYFNDKLLTLKPSTLKSHRAVLNGAFHYAIINKMVRYNPMLDVKLTTRASNYETFLDLETASQNEEVFTKEEVETILETYKNNSSIQKHYLPILISYYTGMREGEVCALSWDCIDFKKKQIKVNKNMYYETKLKRWELGKPKNGKIRIIDIGETLLNELKEERKKQLSLRSIYANLYQEYYYEIDEQKDGKHVFITQDSSGTAIDFVCKFEDGTLYTNSTCKQIGKRCEKYTGIPFNFHKLRHTHATLLIENGANIKDVQNRLGHANYQITMDTYSHVTQKMKNETVNIFERLAK